MGSALLAAACVLSCGSSSSSPSNGPTVHTGLFTFASAAGDPLAADAANLYWVGAKGIMSEPLAGGDETLLAGGGVFNCYGLTVDAQHAYWTNFDKNTVWSVPVAGGSPTQLAASPAPPYSIVAGPDAVYWVATSPGASGSSAIVSVPKGGGTATTVVSTATEYAGTIAVDSSRLYWALEQDSAIQAQPLTGGMPTTIASTSVGPVTSMVLAGSTIYFVSFEGGAVLSVPTSGGTPKVLASNQRPLALAVDGSAVYFTDQGPMGTTTQASICKVPLGGGAVQTMVSGRNPSGMGDIAVGPSYVYWVELAAKVMGFPK